MTGEKITEENAERKGANRKIVLVYLNDAFDISAYTATLFVRLHWTISGRVGRAMTQVISSVLPEQK
jgi:hypothetical protein